MTWNELGTIFDTIVNKMTAFRLSIDDVDAETIVQVTKNNRLIRRITVIRYALNYCHSDK